MGYTTGTKWTYELVKDFIEVQSDSNCVLISNKYINRKEKLTIRCNCGEIFLTSFESFLSKNKRQCNECSNIKLRKNNSFSYQYAKNFVNSK
jgi:hypothetical protein